MKIYNASGIEILDIEVDDTSVRYRSIMGDDSLTLKFSVTAPLSIPVGSYCDYQGARYLLYYPENFKKNHSRDFEYTLTLHGYQESLKLFKYKDISGKPYRLKFPLTATPDAFLQLLVDVMNLHDTGWSKGDCIVAEEKLISFNHEYCYDVLQRIAQEFSTEWEVAGKVIHLRRVEKYKDTPLALSYGMGNGFKSGVGRQNNGDKQPIGVLYVEGGEDNIDFATYQSKSLLLPKLASLVYNGRTYQTDADGMYITRMGNNNKAEGSFDGSRFYPKRAGTVTTAEVIDLEKHFYDIIDIGIPEALDYTTCRIAGEKAIIVFQTGALAGREFDIEQTDDSLTGYIHAEKRFKIVPQELDGMIMPGGVFVPAVGDKYAIFNIRMPQAYISDDVTQTGASWDMFRGAVKHFAAEEEDKYSFTGQLDGVWSRSRWLEIGGQILPGGYILFSDEQFQQTGVLIRITAVKDYVNTPHKPEITLSNASIAGSLSSDLDSLEAEEVIREAEKKEMIRFTKRQWRDAKETMSMLQDSLLNFSGAINPVTVQTMQLLVGDQSLQFSFVSSKITPVVVPHSISFDATTKVLAAAAGILQHMTLGITTVKNIHAASEYKFWDMALYNSPPLDPGKSYYLYARCDSAGTTGVFLLSETGIKMDAVAGYYHFLVGILNSEYNGDRSFATLYGFTEILPGQVTTDRIVSQDGATYFDLLNGIIAGKIRFLSSGVETDLEAWADGTSSAVNSAQAAADNAATAAGNAQAAANSAQTDATNALGQLTGIVSDNVLSAAEKPQQRQAWNVVSAEKAGINTQAAAFGITTENTAYNNAFQALANYLNAGVTWTTGIPSWLSDANLSANTVIVGSAYRSTWQAFYAAKTALLQAISSKAKALADAAQTAADSAATAAANAQTAASNAQSAANAAQTDASNALGQLTNIVSDNVLSAAEKPQQRQTWNVISAEKSGINNQASAFGITTENTAYNNAFQALANYLNAGVTWTTGIPSWLSDANLSANTVIVGSAYRSTWQAFYAAKTALLQAISTKAKALADAAQSTANSAATAAANAQTAASNALTAANNAQTAATNAQTDATSALTQLTGITSDSVLSAAEKPQQRQTWNVISAEKSGINNQAGTFGITAENTAYNNAFQSLANYLNAGVTWTTGIPSWLSDANLSVNTVIVGSTYRSTWQAFYATKTALLQAISTKAKALADAAQTAAGTAQATANTAKAITDKFGTTVEGGLVSAVVMELRESNSPVVTAGTSGIQNGGIAPAFWAGGNYDEAINNIAKAIIRHDGSSKFTDAEITGVINALTGNIGVLTVEASGRIVLTDPVTGNVRLVFSQSDIPLIADLTSGITDGDSASNTSQSNISVGYVLPNAIIVDKNDSSISFDAATLSVNATIASMIDYVMVNVYLRKGGVNFTTIKSVQLYGSGTKSDISAISYNVEGVGTGTYDIYIEVIKTNALDTVSAYISASTLSWSFAQTGIRYFQFGVNGMMAFFSNNHWYFTELDGFDLRGKTNMPGVLLSGTVASAGSWTSVWGHKTSASPPVNNSTGRYTVYHSVGHTNYQVSAVANTASKTCHIVSKSATNFVIEWRTVSSSPALGNTGFDFQIIGNNYA